MEQEKYKASIFRKVFNCICLGLNTIHLGFALMYVSLGLFVFLFGGFILLLANESTAEVTIAMLATALYTVPAIALFVISIVSVVKCFKYGYKKTLEMTNYISSIVFNVIDVVLAIIFVEFLAEFAIFSIAFSLISIILLIVCIIACVIDRKK